jgi:APA family basic amino acid/polyamine antiporter
LISLSRIVFVGGMFGLPADTWLRLAAWPAIGLVIYLAYGARHSRITLEEIAARR